MNESQPSLRSQLVFALRIIFVIVGACIGLVGLILLLAFISFLVDMGWKQSLRDGAALCSLIFIVIIALGIAIISIAIRAGKRRPDRVTPDGNCPQCGYSLRGNSPHVYPLSPTEWGTAGCPECGWGRGAAE